MSMFGAGSLHSIVVQNVYVWGWILTQDCSTECLCLEVTRQGQVKDSRYGEYPTPVNAAAAQTEV